MTTTAPERIPSRVIRLKDAVRYFSTNKNVFNAEIRPLLHPFRIGKRGIGFDKLELDALIDALSARNERSRKEESWNENYQKDSSGEKSQGEDDTRTSTSKRCTGGTTYVTLAKQVIRERRKGG